MAGYNAFLSYAKDDQSSSVNELADILYNQLKKDGFYVFNYGQIMDKGMRSEMFKAIREPMISYIIFSKAYAFSTDCLEELTEIMESRHAMGQVVRPVFYDLTPFEVRKQEGEIIRDAFSKHGANFAAKMEKVQRWRGAMSQAARLKSGFDLSGFNNIHKVQRWRHAITQAATKFHFYNCIRACSMTGKTVFLSYAKDDASVKNWADITYNQYKKRGYGIFSYGQITDSLEKGKALKESRLSHVLISKAYASSPDCLDELVEIMEWRNTTGQSVCTTFVDLTPSEVRKQKGRLEQVFCKHEANFTAHKVQRWRNTLTQAADLTHGIVLADSDFDSASMAVENKNVFLSYAKDDPSVKEWAYLVYHVSKNGGCHVLNYDQTLDKKRSEMLKAIKKSRMSHIIFSKTYASSANCLDELVEIMNCRQTMGQLVNPVFLDVTPSEIRKQQGRLEQIFCEHEANFSADKVQRWRDALTQAADLELGLILPNCDGDGTNNTTSPQVSCSYSVPKWEYDAFLSFVDEDTTINNLAGHFYDAMQQNGLYCFRDHQNIDEKGKAIRESRFSVIIFSKTYASSDRRLDQLVEILECRKTHSGVVLPVFYDVNPSEVRNQTGSFEQAFSSYSSREQKERVRRWREALTQAANLSGFTLQQFNGYERQFIEAIVNDISNKLSLIKCGSDLRELVGVRPRLDKLISQMNLGCDDDVLFVGIHGMGGIGKTTLARAFYEQMSFLFEASCFLDNVREVSQKDDDLAPFHRQLVSEILNEETHKIWNTYDGVAKVSRRFRYKKVLIVIDDVNHISQLATLAGSRDWFGKGSRIIITTRDEHLLIGDRVDVVYKAELLNHDEALELLSRNAFKNDFPPDLEYWKLCEDVVKCVKSLPLALKLLGSSLFGRSVDEWKLVLERLKKDSEEDDVFNCLRISYDLLSEDEKKIFLDVAFFFKGMHKDKDYVMDVLDSCDFYPGIGVKILIEKSLISLSNNNKLLMHDLVEDMAKKIVQREHPKKPYKRSRLCKQEEVYHLLMNSKGTKANEGITHKFRKEEEMPLSDTAFVNMTRLRILKIFNVKLPQGLEYLSNELRFLEWHGYPLSYLPSRFQPDGIVILKLPRSRIQHLWEGVKDLNMLKVIDLSFSENLREMPSVEGVPHLEILNLKGCTELSELHSSIGFLKKLITLDLTRCVNISTLPSFFRLESLEVCNLFGCSKLDKLPEIKCKMDRLQKIDLRGTAIDNVNSTVMNNLRHVCLGGFLGDDSSMFVLPPLFYLRFLTHLVVSFCKLDEGAFPDALGQLYSLIKLELNGNDFVSLPSFIGQLPNLKFLFLEHCKRLKSLAGRPPNVEMVSVIGCSSMVEWLKQLYRKEFGSRSYWEDLSSKYEMIDCPHLRVAFSSMRYRYGCDTFSLLHERSTDVDKLKIGSDVPQDYLFNSEGDSVSIYHDNDRGKKGMVVGMLACCVFGFNNDVLTSPTVVAAGNNTFPFFLDLLVFTNRRITLQLSTSFLIDEQAVAVGNNYLWVAYIPLGTQNKLDSRIDIQVLPREAGGVEVKRCGIRLLSRPEFIKKDINSCIKGVIKSVDIDSDSGKAEALSKLELLRSAIENAVSGR